MNNEALIARIRKLMAMANHPGSNENEAAVAATKIQDLLAEHNLSMAEIGGLEQSGPVVEKREKTQHQRSAMYKYQQDLMRVLAKNNFCMYFLEQVPRISNGKMRNTMVHVLLGRAVNVEVTKMTYDYLVEAMDRLMPYAGMQKRGREALLWLAGCTDRLVERLNERREKAEAESQKKAEAEAVRSKHPGAASVANALVVLSDVYGSEEDLNRDAMYGYEPGTTARKRRENEARRAARQATIDAKIAELVASGMNEDDAWYVANGMTPPSRQPQVEKKESPSQRARRERAEQNYSYRYWHRQEKEERRKESAEYRAGHRTAETIGLDDQVSAQKRRSLR